MSKFSLVTGQIEFSIPSLSLWVPYPIRTLAVMVLHSSRFLVLSMISTSLIFNSWLRLFIKFSRGLPLLLSPSIFPVTTMFSSLCFLMICPRKLICPALILFINFLSALPLLNTSSFVIIMLKSLVPNFYEDMLLDSYTGLFSRNGSSLCLPFHM